MTAAFACAWADAAQRSGVRVACLAVLSNHYHAVVYDPEGKLADQLRDVHSVVSRFGNALDGVGEHFWDPQQTHVEELLDAATIVEKMAYVMANPVRHRLVASPSVWPGLLTKVEDVGTGQVQRFDRPGIFFAGDAPAELRFEVPPTCLTAYGAEGFRRLLSGAIQQLVKATAAEARRDGRGFAGVGSVQAQGRMDRPTSPSKRTAGKRSPARPSVAASDRDVRLAAIERIARFRAAYRACLEAFRDGIRDVVFPAGTWLMRRVFGVACEPDEPAAARVG